jgi:hypothetical protein
MRKLIFLFFVGLAITLSSCRQDFVFEPSTGDLKFSRDTIYLDTVFANIGSSTYTLKVYNRSNKDIKIPSIRLAKGVGSKYRMTVDGMTGFENRVFRDVELLAKDSMYIFIETTAGIADANSTDFLYTDQIEFDSGDNLQKVELVTLIQDAYFIFPNKQNGITESIPIGFNEDGTVLETNGRNLSNNHPDNGNEYLFKTDKPYVVYGYASVPSGETLTIPGGARVHFHADSGLVIQQGGTLHIDGSTSSTAALENEVIFEGDRLEPGFSDVPGQWGTIYLRQGSGTNTHRIKNLTLKNAIIGLLVENNAGTTMTIENTQIYDCSNVGLLGRAARIEGKNIVINTAGVATLACTLGGSYEFKHCTFNNNWQSSRQVAVLVDNYFTDTTTNQQVAFDLVKADFKNCIIFGGNQVELLINKSTDTSKQFNKLFSKCQIKFNNTNNQFTNNSDYAFINDTNEIIKNGTVDFLDINNNKLFIGADSDAKGFGVDVGVPFDILGNARNSVFDLGAYNSIVFPAD